MPIGPSGRRARTGNFGWVSSPRVIFLLLLGTTRQDSSDSRGPCGVVLGRNPTVSLGWSVAAIGYYQKALVRNMGVSPDKTTQLKS